MFVGPKIAFDSDIASFYRIIAHLGSFLFSITNYFLALIILITYYFTEIIEEETNTRESSAQALKVELMEE